MDGSDDPSYRYKMPRVQAKVEGRGNGIKTCILGVSGVAQACKRPAAQVTKFFGCELGAQSKYLEDEDRALVNGAFETRDLQDLVFKYLEYFVNCRACGNPETTMSIKGKKKGATVWLKCLACGETTEAESTHKLATFIMKAATSASGVKLSKKEAREARKKKRLEKKEKGEDSGSDGEKKSKKDKKAKKSKKSKKSKEDETDEERKARRKARKEKKKKEKKSKKKRGGSDDDADDSDGPPVATLEALTVDDSGALDAAVESLRAFVADGNDDDVEIVRKICELQTFSGLTPLQRIHIAYRCFFEEKTFAEFSKKLDVMGALASEFGKLGQLEILACLEQSVVRGKALEKSTSLATSPLVVKAMFDADGIEELTIMDWFNGDPNTDISPSAWKSLKSKVQPIVTWLAEAESSSGEDDDESDEEE